MPDMVDVDHINKVHQLDVKKVQERLRYVCDQASEEWIPRNAIADALLLQYVDTAYNAELISQLEKLLILLKSRNASGTLH